MLELKKKKIRAGLARACYPSNTCSSRARAELTLFVRARARFTALHITVSLHQVSASSPYLLALVIEEIQRHVQDDIPWRMLFADILF